MVERMKAALEPDRSSTRDIVMVTHTGGESAQWAARQARKTLKDGNRMLTVLLAPPDVKGIALLIQERRNENGDRQWLYLPYLRRVREILPLGTFETFLGTDFTTADLGFVDLRQRTFSLLGEEKLGNVQTYKVQEVLKDPRYYSRVVTGLRPTPCCRCSASTMTWPTGCGRWSCTKTQPLKGYPRRYASAWRTSRRATAPSFE